MVTATHLYSTLTNKQKSLREENSVQGQTLGTFSAVRLKCCDRLSTGKLFLDTRLPEGMKGAKSVCVSRSRKHPVFEGRPRTSTTWPKQLVKETMWFLILGRLPKALILQGGGGRPTCIFLWADTVSSCYCEWQEQRSALGGRSKILFMGSDRQPGLFWLLHQICVSGHVHAATPGFSRWNTVTCSS